MNDQHDPKNEKCHMFRAVHPACDGSNEVCNDCSCPADRQQADHDVAQAIRDIMNSKQPLSVAKSEGVRKGSA
jgi:hypothetical protein